MKPWTKAAFIGAGVAGSAATAAALGSRRWEKTTAQRIAELFREVTASEPAIFPLEQLEGLPEPVARYFKFALTPGQPLLRRARLEQRGEFRIGGIDARWHPLTAVQHVSVRPPGFIWDARIRMAPMVDVRVRDVYCGGSGSMQARLASLVPVAEEQGRPELNAGALHRYLAEAVWLPTALLPSHGVVWKALDECTARASLTDAGTRVSLEFRFGPDGVIERAYTPERYRLVNGAFVPTAWQCTYSDYTRIGPVIAPRQGEVSWLLPEGWLSYWRGRILAIDGQLAA